MDDFLYVAVICNRSYLKNIRNYFEKIHVQHKNCLQESAAFTQWEKNPAWLYEVPASGDWNIKTFLVAMPSLGYFGHDSILGRYENFFDSIETRGLVEMVGVEKIHPFSIIAIALGSDLYKEFPGFLGNMAISSDNVRESIDYLNKVYTKAGGINEMIKRVAQFALFHDRNDYYMQGYKEILHVIPDGLERALQRNCGFLSMVC